MRKSQRKIKNESKAKEHRRKLAIRKKVVGTTERPRVCASKSNKNIYVQVVDDVAGKTLFSVQTYGKAAVGNGANACRHSCRDYGDRQGGCPQCRVGGV